jgi:exodeoxyribonuclease VII large subunit
MTRPPYTPPLPRTPPGIEDFFAHAAGYPANWDPSLDEGESLSRLLERVSTVVSGEFRDSLWVRAEVSDFRINPRSRHAYFNLVERDEEGAEVAKAGARIWKTALDRIQAKFRNGAGESMASGMKVMLRVRVEFHPQYGFGLTVEDVDPSWSIGEMERRLREIRTALAREGLIGLNKARPAPGEFTRVAVISPAAAAGLGDFMVEALGLEQVGLCEFILYTATFEGAQAAQSVRAAFDEALSDHAFGAREGRGFDALCVIRGGGAATSLAWLNDIDLARTVCRAGLPVFTGIGHERDGTILDEVAHSRFDTPSKVIGHIVSTIIGNAREAERAVAELDRFAVAIVSEAESRIASLRDQLGHDADRLVLRAEAAVETQLVHLNGWARRVVDLADSQLEENHARLLPACRAAVERIGAELGALGRELLGLGPGSTLGRGYAIAMTPDRRPVGSAAAARVAGTLDLVFRDGMVRAGVESSETIPEPNGPVPSGFRPNEGERDERGG